MRTVTAIFPALLLLAACGDPLAGVERVSDGVELPQNTAPAALPSQQELQRESSILSGLFRRRDGDTATPVAQDETVDALVPIEAAAPDNVDAELASLPAAGEVDAVIAAALDEGEVSVSTEPEPANDSTLSAKQAPRDVAAQPRARKGVLGWLRNAAVAQAAEPQQIDPSPDADAVANADTAPTPDVEVVEDTRLASLPTDAIAPDLRPERVEPSKRAGLFGRGAPKVTAGMQLRDVPLGTTLPFGEVGRVCDVRPAEIGNLVEQAASEGPGYSLYDSAPDSATARTFYVTGFADNCARQFTAALAIFGSPAFHEQLRYGLPAEEYPYSTTDKAYEKVKKQVCNVEYSKPCGPRISRLEDTTVFISVYEHFEENARWADMLLHDGALLAAALKTP